jgi:hypothetical protein
LVHHGVRGVPRMNITGRPVMQRESRLRVLREARVGGRLLYECLCECSVIKFIRADAVRHKRVKSCGCLARSIVNVPRPVTSKVCRECGIEKPASDFYSQKLTPDRLRYECKRCSTAKAKANASQNRERVRVRDKAWRVANKDKADAAAKRQREKHRIKRRLAQREYARAHRDEQKARVSKWIAENPARYRAMYMRNWQKRRAAKLQAVPSWADHDAINATYAECAALNAGNPRAYHVDHIVPLQSSLVCGLHVHTNLQILPGAENSRKCNREWPDMP